MACPTRASPQAGCSTSLLAASAGRRSARRLDRATRQRVAAPSASAVVRAGPGSAVPTGAAPSTVRRALASAQRRSSASPSRRSPNGHPYARLLATILRGRRRVAAAHAVTGAHHQPRGVGGLGRGPWAEADPVGRPVGADPHRGLSPGLPVAAPAAIRAGAPAGARPGDRCRHLGHRARRALACRRPVRLGSAPGRPARACRPPSLDPDRRRCHPPRQCLGERLVRSSRPDGRWSGSRPARPRRAPAGSGPGPGPAPPVRSPCRPIRRSATGAG